MSDSPTRWFRGIARSRWSPWVTLLAWIGVVVLAVQLWGYVAWLIDPHLGPIRSPVPVPATVIHAVRVAELSSVIGAAFWALYLVWDWRRRRTLTWPMLWTIAWITVFWQEPLVNALHHTFSFNLAFHNLGDWTAHLPLAPHSYTPLPEALILEGLVFAYLLPLIATVIPPYLRMWRRMSGISHPLALALIAYLSVVVFDVAFELQGIHQQLLRYVEIGGPAISRGTSVQWPWFEGFAISAAWAFPGIVAYLIRDHRAGSDPSRPVQKEARMPTARTLLVAIGAVNLIFGLYNAGYVAVMHGTVSPQPPWLSSTSR